MMNGLDLSDLVAIAGGALGAGGLMGWAYWLGNPDAVLRRRIAREQSVGPWCIARDRGFAGYQLLYASRGKTKCVKWRNRHRNEFEETLYLLRIGAVRNMNADLLESEEYWAWLENVILNGDAAIERLDEMDRKKNIQAMTEVIDMPSVAREASPFPGVEPTPNSVPTRLLSISRGAARLVQDETPPFILTTGTALEKAKGTNGAR